MNDLSREVRDLLTEADAIIVVCTCNDEPSKTRHAIPITEKARLLCKSHTNTAFRLNHDKYV